MFENGKNDNNQKNSERTSDSSKNSDNRKNGNSQTINKRKVGADYETIAVEFLVKNGYEIIERNYHCKIGEIDIIAKDYGKYKIDGNHSDYSDERDCCSESTLVFVEVKYRRSQKYGSPLEAVDFRKQKKIMAVSAYYIKEKRIHPERSIRYDVVGILGEEIQLIKNAFGSM